MILICKGNKKNRHQKDIPFFFTSQLLKFPIIFITNLRIKEFSIMMEFIGI